MFRESSPTSHSRVVQKISNSELPRLTPTKQAAPNNGGRNEALAAASFVGQGKQRAAETSKITKQTYDKPPIPHLNLAASETKEKNRNNAPPPEAWRQSTPQIAALLAVSKSSPIETIGLLPNLPRQTNLPNKRYDSTLTETQTDKTPILATNTLIKLFESQKQDHSLRPHQVLGHPQAPQPQNRSSINTSRGRTGGVDSEALRPPDHAKFSEKSKLSDDRPVVGIPAASKSDESPPEAGPNSQLLARSKESDKINSIRGPAPPPPPPRRTGKANEVIKEDRRISSEATSSPSSYASAVANFEPPSETIKPKGELLVKETQKSLSPNVRTDLPKRLSPSPSEGKIRFGKDEQLRVPRQHSREGTLDPHSRTPQLTADSLANAMVASSLASSRASSPGRQAPPLPRRHSKAHSLFHRSESQENIGKRTPSPGRVMRQTMRGTPKSDEEGERKRKGGHILKKHPNKHREGARKRWRDEITEQERKRYEGVWAANKGLFVPSKLPDSNSTVLNLVVRDIWRRSRLPNEVLAEVWDLVDTSGTGSLSKEEFVVGMWLIDQRLKGRKLPVRVSESVWFSARRLSGLKVPKSTH